MANKTLARLCGTTLFTLLALCPAFPQQTFTQNSGNGYTLTITTGIFDNTSACVGVSGHNCWQPITNGATVAFTQIDIAKGGGGIFAFGTDNFIYDLEFPGGDFSKSAAWVKKTAWGNTAVVSVSAQDASNIYGLGLHSGCAGATARKISKLNTTQTGWNAISPTQCADKMAVSADGTLLSVDATAGTVSYKRIGDSAWSLMAGTGFTGQPAVMDSTIAYALKGGNLYYLNLTANNATLITNMTNAVSVSVDQRNKLWVTDSNQKVWEQDRSALTALTGPWTQFAGSIVTLSTGGDTTFGLTAATGAFHLSTIGLSAVSEGSGTYNGGCPSGDAACSCVPDQYHQCPPAPTHTIQTSAYFDQGGVHGPNGVTNQATGNPLSYLSSRASETGQDCSPFDSGSVKCKPRGKMILICSIMGIFGSIIPTVDIMFAITKSIWNGQQFPTTLPPYGMQCVLTDWCAPGSGPFGAPPLASYSMVTQKPATIGGPQAKCFPYYISRSICERLRVLSGGPLTNWLCQPEPLSVLIDQQSYGTIDPSLGQCTGPSLYWNMKP